MIVVVRHGRTESNASGLLLGRPTRRWTHGADRRRPRWPRALVSTESVDRIVCSPLIRASATAAAIADAVGVPVEIDDRFIELDYGDWDQRPLGEVTASEWGEWRGDPSFAPPGGESLAALGVRVRSGLDELADDARRRTVVVVTHVSPIKAAVVWAVGGHDGMAWRMFVAPASITRIATAGGSPALHGFNDVSHLSA